MVQELALFEFPSLGSGNEAAQESLQLRDKVAKLNHISRTNSDSLNVRSVDPQFQISPSVTNSGSPDGECVPEFTGKLPYEYMKLGIGQSLPDLAGELIAAQCSQNAEVGQREEEMMMIQTDQYQEQKLLKSTEREIHSCNRMICLAQSDLTVKMDNFTMLKEKMHSLVSECHDLKLQIKRAEAEGKREKKCHEQCQIMMNNHIAQVREMEKKLPLQNELEYLQSHMEELTEHRIYYMKEDGVNILRGEKQQKLQNKVSIVEASTVKQRDENRQLELKIENRRDRIQQLKRELEVSSKRHIAQMTRLQRQVTEAQSRRRQWVEEIIRLKQAIHNLKQKIEE